MSDLRPLIEETYLTWAARLEPLDAAAWQTASTCEGWTVRMVVAHVTMAARYDEEAFGRELAADGYDFGKLSDRVAERDASLPTAELLHDLRSPTLHAWEPPGGGATGALTHAVIHSADATVPLGLDPAAPAEALRVVLDQLGPGGLARAFGVDPGARPHRATDVDWRFGDGAGQPVEASAVELVLLLAGRQLPEG